MTIHLTNSLRIHEENAKENDNRVFKSDKNTLTFLLKSFPSIFKLPIRINVLKNSAVRPLSDLEHSVVASCFKSHKALLPAF